MKYFIVIQDDYILAIFTNDIGECEISEAEYNTILGLIRNKPQADSGYDYRLKSDLTWELCELPPTPEDDEISAEEALEIIRGGAV